MCWTGCSADWGLILSGILMVGVWNVWQLAAVPGSGLVLPAPGLFVLQSEPVPYTKQPPNWTLDPAVWPCGKPRCFNLLTHLFSFEYSIMVLFDRSGVAPSPAGPLLLWAVLSVLC